MTVRGSVNVPFFLVAGYSVLGDITQIEDSWEALTEETGALGDSWVEHTYVGVKKGAISQKGFYNDGVGSVHEMLSTGVGVSRVLCYGLEGTATNANFMGFAGALETKYTRMAQRGMLQKADALYTPSGKIDQGKIVHMLNTRTASGQTTGTPIDNGASSLGGGAGYLQVTALASSGAPFVPRFMHSSDNITYANLGNAFAGLTSGTVPAAERQIISTAAIERYVAMDWTFTGGSATNASVTFFAGLARY